MGEANNNPALMEAIDRARGGLGRSARVQALFAYLAASSLAGRSPKESEIAIEVFGRQPDFDPARDAIVRVYVHKLRQRLEAAAEPGVPGLTIPRGEYRLELVADQVTSEAPARSHSRWLAIAAAILALAILSGLLALWLTETRTAPERAARSAVWAALLDNGRPTIIALGDYYIFGDAKAPGGAPRLVREYTVNSAADLDRFRRDNPDRAMGYMDLDLHYLPVGSADALASVAQILSDAKARRILPISRVTPSMLRDSNIVYIGYLSGLGVLRDATFGGSRYEIGETWDDVVDTVTDQRFESGGGTPFRNESMYADLGYLSTFEGPSGNRVVIIAGTRDAALSQMGQSALSEGVLGRLAKLGGAHLAAEALFGVNSLAETGIDSRLIRAGPLDQARIWDQPPDTAKPFPPG